MEIFYVKYGLNLNLCLKVNVNSMYTVEQHIYIYNIYIYTIQQHLLGRNRLAKKKYKTVDKLAVVILFAMFIFIY